MDIAEKYTNEQVYLSEDCSQKEEVLWSMKKEDGRDLGKPCYIQTSKLLEY